MSPERKFDDRLGGYVEVKDRIKLFYEKYPTGSVCTAEIRFPLPDDDVPRITVRAYAFRGPDDPHPGVGSSWMVLPGSTPYTKGSELENTETSAWGRAIGALGIGIDKSIASANEVLAKGGEVRADVERSDDGGLVGTVEVGDKASSDFLPRQTPDGPELGFRLRGGKGGILVETFGPLATQLSAQRPAVVGKRVTVWGKVASRSFTAKGGKEVTFQVLSAERVRVPEIGDLPVDTAPAGSAGPGGPTGLTEAESDAIWAELEAVTNA